MTTSFQRRGSAAKKIVSAAVIMQIAAGIAGQAQATDVPASLQVTIYEDGGAFVSARMTPGLCREYVKDPAALVGYLRATGTLNPALAGLADGLVITKIRRGKSSKEVVLTGMQAADACPTKTEHVTFVGDRDPLRFLTPEARAKFLDAIRASTPARQN